MVLLDQGGRKERYVECEKILAKLASRLHVNGRAQDNRLYVVYLFCQEKLIILSSPPIKYFLYSIALKP